MSLDIDELNNKLRTIESSTPLDDIRNRAKDSVTNLNVKISTVLTDIGDIAGGIESLTQAEDQIKESTVKPVIGKITSNVPGLENVLTKEVSDTSSLETLTGSSITDGFNVINITLGSPDAIKDALSDVKVASATISQANTAVQNIVDPSLVDDVFDKIDVSLNENLTPAFGKISSLTESFVGTDLSEIINNIADTDEMKELFLNIENSSFIRKLYKIRGPITDVKEVVTNVDNILGTIGGINELSTKDQIDVIKKTVGTIGTIQKILKKNDVTSSVIIPPTGIFNQVDILGKDDTLFDGTESTKYPFKYISSEEEMLSEIKRSSRDITTAVVQWTETHTNNNLNANDIHRNAISLGLDGIQQHFVIRRNGNIQRGRPIDLEGLYSENHNKHSIAILFVGGINAPTGTTLPMNQLSSKSLTSAQMSSFNQLLKSLYTVKPGIQVIGNNNLGEQDPGFDVPEYVKSLFNKRSVYEYVQEDDQLPSSADLVTKEIINDRQI